MTDRIVRTFRAKRDWHAHQREQPIRSKIETIIKLQKRQQAINRTKGALGLPPVPMRVWQTKP
jgi:hypothetical protein